MEGSAGRMFRLARGWYGSAEGTLAWALTAATLLLTVAQVGAHLGFNLWNRAFFDALQARGDATSPLMLGSFAALVLTAMGLAVAQLWARQMLALRWRRWLVHALQDRWLAGATAYRLGLMPDAADNPDQRISENTRWATAIAVELAVGLLRALLGLVSFAGILWSLSGSVALFGVLIPGDMLLAALAYAGLGGIATYVLGRPLIGINIRRNTAEADHRFALLRLRENAEAVACLGGGADAATGLRGSFAQVMRVMRDMLRTERHLMWLGAGFGLVAAALPLLLASPRYLSGELSLGALVQLGQAFVEVVVALSWAQEAWPRIADWRSQVERVAALEDSFAVAETLPGGIGLAPGPALVLRDLTLRTPDGRPLLEGVNARIGPGERVLIRGASGSGKSTLFRAIAGLWPWGAGMIEAPAGMLLLPQRPYLPLGTLAQALAYPAAPDRFAAAALAAALARCGLPGLVGRLGEVARWDRSLSLGEQQRLGFARLLLHAPAWVLLDEATSALDEPAEAALMRLLGEALPGSAVISVGHRPGLAHWHDRVWQVDAPEPAAQVAVMRASRITGPQRATSSAISAPMAAGLEAR